MSAQTELVAVRGITGGRGRKRTPTYNSWRAMIDRCTRPSHPRYEDYGGRGVQVDPSWRGPGGFARFLADVGQRPAGRTLDRIDVNGHYTPANVRWADKWLQRWNRRDMHERSPERDDRVDALFELDEPYDPRDELDEPADLPF